MVVGLWRRQPDGGALLGLRRRVEALDGSLTVSMRRGLAGGARAAAERSGHGDPHLSNAGIAEALVLIVAAVEKHIASIFRKLRLP